MHACTWALMMRCFAGTRVDAQTLLTSVENDFCKGKVANMMQTPEGRALLEQLFGKLATDLGPAIMDAEAILGQRGCRVQDETTVVDCPSTRVQFQGFTDEKLMRGARSEESDVSRMADAPVLLAGHPLEIQPRGSFNGDEEFDICNIFGEDLW